MSRLLRSIIIASSIGIAALSNDASALDQSSASLPAAGSMPFVDQSGLVRDRIRYSDLVARLGEPASAEVFPEQKVEQRVVGGELLLGYPELGLAFRIAREDRGEKDPTVSAMHVRHPWRSGPPNIVSKAWSSEPGSIMDPKWIVRHADASSQSLGLHTSMGTDALRELIGARYRVLDDQLRNGQGHVTLSDSSIAPSRHVKVLLKDDRVYGLDFTTADRPLLRLDGLTQVLRWGAAALIVAGAAWLLVWTPRHRPDLVRRMNAIDDAYPVHRGPGLWPLRALGLLLVSIGAFFLFAGLTDESSQHLVTTIVAGPLAIMAGVTLLVLGGLLLLVRRTHYRPMRQLRGILVIAALVLAARVAGVIPQF